MRRRAKVDANQREIVAAFERLGCSVLHLHQVGCGCPDLLVAARGVNILVEVKDGSKSPSRRKLTTAQEAFHATWPGMVVTVETVSDASDLAAALHIRGGRVVVEIGETDDRGLSQLR